MIEGRKVIGDVEQISNEEREAIACLVRAAMHVVNVSPAGKALAGSAFAAAIRTGEASVAIELKLPMGPLRIFATADDERHEIVCVPFGQPRTDH